MFVKFKRYKYLTIVLSLLLILIPSYFAYERYQYDAFKRAYEQKTIYEQLDILMNSTRYVNAVRKAGYSIDDYNVKMLERISSIETKGGRPVTIISPDDGVTMITVKKIGTTPNVTSTFQFNNELELEYVGYMKIDSTSQERIEVDDETTNKIADEVRAEAKAMLKDIYQSMYPNEK